LLSICAILGFIANSAPSGKSLGFLKGTVSLLLFSPLVFSSPPELSVFDGEVTLDISSIILLEVLNAE